VLGVGRSGELLPQQAGEEHQRAERPVVDDDVLRLPVGVERDQVDGPDRCAANLGGVVLDEAVVAPGAGEVEVLTVVQLAGAADDGADGVRSCTAPSSSDPSKVTSSASLSTPAG
jgi:hypothetical protein